MSIGERFKTCCHIHWQGFFYFFSPLAILPLVFLEPAVQWRTIFIILWSLIWYLAEPAPLASVGIIPIVFIPILGIMSSNDVCMCFSRNSNMLFMLCNFIAVAMQHSNVVKRHAYFLLAHFSCDPRKILVVIMIFSYLLTAFVPAAFVCALMMPTVKALLQYLEDINVCKALNEDIELNHDETPYPSKVAISFYTGVAYAINIGSITMALASDSGLALQELIENEPDLSSLEDFFHLKYILLSFPVSLALLVFTIFYLEIIFLGLIRPESKDAEQITVIDSEASREALANIMNDLPPLNAHMLLVSVLFFCSMIGIILCSILNPEVNNKALKYSFNAMLLCFLYFVLPRNLDFCNYFRLTAPKEFKTAPSVLPWGPVHKFTPWSTFFVHGSSVALGYALKHTDTHLYVGNGLLTMKSQVAQQIGFILLTMFMTLFASNNFVADIMLNMGLKVADGGKAVAPLLYPITWSTCLAFLLPVSSSATCFAMGWGNVRAKDMMLAAIGPTVVGFLVTLIMALIMVAIATL